MGVNIFVNTLYTLQQLLMYSSDLTVGSRRWDYWRINATTAVLVSDFPSPIWCCRYSSKTSVL